MHRFFYLLLLACLSSCQPTTPEVELLDELPTSYSYQLQLSPPHHLWVLGQYGKGYRYDLAPTKPVAQPVQQLAYSQLLYTDSTLLLTKDTLLPNQENFKDNDHISAWNHRGQRLWQHRTHWLWQVQRFENQLGLSAPEWQLLDPITGTVRARQPYHTLGPLTHQKGWLWLERGLDANQASYWEASIQQDSLTTPFIDTLHLSSYAQATYDEGAKRFWIYGSELYDRSTFPISIVDKATLSVLKELALPLTPQEQAVKQEVQIGSYSDGWWIWLKNTSFFYVISKEYAARRIPFDAEIVDCWAQGKDQLYVVAGNALYVIDLENQEKTVLWEHTEPLQAGRLHDAYFYGLGSNGKLFRTALPSNKSTR